MINILVREVARLSNHHVREKEIFFAKGQRILKGWSIHDIQAGFLKPVPMLGFAFVPVLPWV